MLTTARSSAPAASDREDKRILLVDDNDAVRRGLARYLEIHGFEITEARDGTSAIAELENANPFPIVLTDLRLPDTEGIEVARRAREIAETTWVGLITGWDIDPDDRTYDTFDAILLKPIDTAGLVSRLRSVGTAS